MSGPGSPRLEVCVAASIGAAAALVLVTAWDIPYSQFEPMGSGTVPRVVASVILLLSLVVVLPGILHWARNRPAAPRMGRAAWDLGVGLVGLVVYVLALDIARLPFPWVTSAYLFLMIVWFARGNWPAVVPAAVIALTVAWGATYVFTQIFLVDLPV